MSIPKKKKKAETFEKATSNLSDFRIFNLFLLFVEWKLLFARCEKAEQFSRNNFLDENDYSVVGKTCEFSEDIFSKRENCERKLSSVRIFRVSTE